MTKKGPTIPMTQNDANGSIAEPGEVQAFAGKKAFAGLGCASLDQVGERVLGCSKPVAAVAWTLEPNTLRFCSPNQGFWSTSKIATRPSESLQSHLETAGLHLL